MFYRHQSIERVVLLYPCVKDSNEKSNNENNNNSFEKLITYIIKKIFSRL